jgi:methionine-rich copper-binding protein CopC
MMLHNTIRRLATAGAVAVVALALVPGLVLGHAELETPTPADKSTVTEPVAEVSGIYSQAMKADGSSLVVKDGSGVEVVRGTVDPEDDTRMVATPTTPLGDGTYTVESTSLATDGDIEHATWTFTVAVAATPSPTTRPTTAPTAAASATPAAAPTPVPATPVTTVAPAPSPSGDGSTTGSGGDVVLPIIVALIVLGAGAAYLLTRRNRPTDQA